MRFSRGKLNNPRSELKAHWLKNGEPACGQAVTSNSTSALKAVTCKKCLQIARARGTRH
jgi:hypothetical protein